MEWRQPALIPSPVAMDDPGALPQPHAAAIQRRHMAYGSPMAAVMRMHLEPEAASTPTARARALPCDSARTMANTRSPRLTRSSTAWTTWSSRAWFDLVAILCSSVSVLPGHIASSGRWRHPERGGNRAAKYASNAAIDGYACGHELAPPIQPAAGARNDAMNRLAKSIKVQTHQPSIRRGFRVIRLSIWKSGRPDSNRQHSAWKADTLPLSYARGRQSVRR